MCKTAFYFHVVPLTAVTTRDIRDISNLHLGSSCSHIKLFLWSTITGLVTVVSHQPTADPPFYNNQHG